MSKQVTVDDLWPGDVVIARRPGGYTGRPCRVVRVEPVTDTPLARIFLEFDDVEYDFVTDWSDEAELVT